MSESLSGKSVAILVTDGFEQSELEQPRTALAEAGAITRIVSPKPDKVRAWDEDDFGDEFEVDVRMEEADPGAFDALLLPGGVMNPDHLRMDPEAVAFVRSFFATGKPVAAICHGPQLLIEADVVEGRKVTSYPSIRRDLINAGANWVDKEVVVCTDGPNTLVSSRRPDDLPAFCTATLEALAASG